MNKLCSGFFAALLWVLSANTVWAGQACETSSPNPEAMQKALNLGVKLQEKLKSLNVEAAVVARAGQDLSAYGLRYSHAAILVKNGDEYQVVHKLNTCGTKEAKIYRQGLGMFFLDDPFEYRSLLIVPPPAQQATIVKLVAEGRHLWVDEPQYSMIAYPYSEDTQNSNGWVIESVAMAFSSKLLQKRENAHKFMQATGYKAKTLRIDLAERVGARLTKANITFFDHPTNRRWQGKYDVVSVESVLEWMQHNGWAEQVFELQ